MDATTLSTLGGVAGLLLSGYGIVKFWMGFSDRITKADSKAEAAELAANNANISVSALRMEHDRIKDDLVRHQVAVAKEYVSKDTMSTLESRVISAIDGLGQRIDNLFKQNVGHH